MKPNEIVLMKERINTLNRDVSAKITEFIAEDSIEDKEMYTEDLVNIFLYWLDKYAEDVKF